MKRQRRLFLPVMLMVGVLSAASSLAQQTDENSIVTLELPPDVAEVVEKRIAKRRASNSEPTEKPFSIKSIRETLGNYYYDLAKSKPPNKRTENLTVAAKNGHAQAQYELASEYSTSAHPPGNSETAIKWFELAAQQGHANAQTMLDQTRTIVARQKQLLYQKQVAQAERAQKTSCAETLQSGYFVCTGESNSYACASYGCDYHWECRREKRISKGNGHVRVVKVRDDSRYGQCREPRRDPGGHNVSYCDPRTGTTDDDFIKLFNKVCR